MYTNVRARIITDQIGRCFSIKKGVKQGDPLSPIIFNSALEEVIRKLSWEQKGININGEELNNLFFADDLVIISSNLEELKEMLKELIESGEATGLKINISKTKILSTENPSNPIVIKNQKIEI